MKPVIETQSLAELFCAVEDITNQLDADQLYEVLVAANSFDQMKEICEMPEAKPEHMYAINQMLWSAYERKIGRV